MITVNSLMKASGIKINFMEEARSTMIMQNNFWISLTIKTFKIFNNIGNFIKVKIFLL